MGLSQDGTPLGSLILRIRIQKCVDRFTNISSYMHTCIKKNMNIHPYIYICIFICGLQSNFGGPYLES